MSVDKLARKSTVLVVCGTGTNAWHPYGFLRQFSMEELLDFKAIFGISGGSCTYYARIMESRGSFSDERIAQFDEIWSRHLNRGDVTDKVIRLVSGRYLFHTQDLHRAMAYVSSSGGFPRRIEGIKLCEGAPGECQHYSDYDFAPAHVKRKLREHLQATYPDCQVVYLNLLKSGSKDNIHWTKTGEDQFPRFGQLFDAFCMAAGIPNGRHYATAIHNRDLWRS